MISPQEVENAIATKLANATVKVVGDGQHFEAIVVSPSFEGQTRVKQHQMVYAAIQEELASEVIHALSLKTYTPETWQAAG
jgi:acid stress-induced BolA-like protein IbaG/YrbA